jgi:hypothetical protein
MTTPGLSARIVASIGLLAAATTACTEGSAARPHKPVAATQPAVHPDLRAPGAPRLGALSPRTLAKGECGLFLWSRTDPPELVFFSNPKTGKAAIVLDDAERSLDRAPAEGAAGADQEGLQTFSTDAGDVSLRLTIKDTEPVQGGYRVSAASLSVTNTKGWSGIFAAAGLATCQS